MPMTKQSMWLIIASLCILISVPMMYIGLQVGHDALAAAGVGMFSAAMLVAPFRKLFINKY